MASIQKLSDQKLVTAHIQKLEQPLAEAVEMIRQIILKADEEISERIKWNNPSFYYTGAMKDFDPKEYKRDFAVLNLHKGRLMIVFPTGDKIIDPSGLLEGNYKDGRRLIIFKDLAEIISKKSALKNMVKEWIKLIDK